MKYYNLILLFYIMSCFSAFSENDETVTLSGNITNINSEILDFASVSLKNTRYGNYTDEKGNYVLSAPLGKYTLVVSAIGYKRKEIPVELKSGKNETLHLQLEENSASLNEVLVVGKSTVRQINESAYNVVAINAKALHNSTLDLGHALDRISGVRVRETGGVGSSYNFSLNGFTGRQVKFFIDGVPMENFGSSFQINNIPINLAERIEVYKGVVPISFGADALGGAVNIVTSTKENTFVDASYSYGSFNTHKSYINVGYTSKSGFMVQLNAFQNYSDNNYPVDVDVADLQTGLYTRQTVKRFHDNYHNETFIANVGVVGKKYADKLLLGITYGKNRADVQTAATMDRVFGERFRRGEIIMPAIKYSKQNLFAKSLDVNINGNYNLGYEQVVDTAFREYNWLGEYKQKPGEGSELSRTMYKYKNNNGVVTANVSYSIAEKHSFTINNVLNTFDRKGSDELYPDNKSNEQPRKTMKNVIGLGYKYDYSKRWNTSVFLKNFLQKTSSFMAQQGSGGWGTTEYVEFKNTYNVCGYGIASTYFLKHNLQAKASYEKSYRLPGNDELFGDPTITLEANIKLKPESSDNFNLGLSYNTTIAEKHGLMVDGNLIYRSAKDFIRPNQNANKTHQVMVNQRDVYNLGFNGEARYSFGRLLSVGANMTYQNLRNNTQYEEGDTRESQVYKDRIPNMPYLFGNADCNLFFRSVGRKSNNLTAGYNLLYVQEYYLRWPSQGLSTTKNTIPTQVSHDVNVTYTILNGRYNISLECRNIADSDLYDNFSLQKPGRSFSAKIRYFFSK